MLDAEMFPQCQLVPHGEHFVSITNTLPSVFVCVSQSTQCASTVVTTDSGLWLTQWHRSIVWRDMMEWWFFHRFLYIQN